MKKLWGVLVGLVAAVVVVLSVEMLSHMIYPPPANIDPDDYEAMAALVEKAPLGALIIVIIGHLIGVFVGIVISLKITKDKSAAYIVIGLFLILTVMNLYMIKHPIWFVVSDISAVILGGGIPYMAFKNK